MFFTHRVSVDVALNIHSFHDYLIDYRQTPKSKMLRRHLAPMEAITEEASVYEQSATSIIMSTDGG